MLPASLSAKWLPYDLVEASQTGGVLTALAYVVMLCVFACELQSSFDQDLLMSMFLDQGSPEFQINLDIDVLRVGCRNLEFGVFDDRHMPIPVHQRDLKLYPLGGDHQEIGIHKIGDDLEELDVRRAQQQRQEDVRKTLDADWAASDKVFGNQSFDQVLRLHDFTLINFVADWCGNCMHFSPIWKDLAEQLATDKSHFADPGGESREVWPAKVNCGVYKARCRENGIDALPGIRLYRSDGSFIPLVDGRRDAQDILRWIGTTIRTKTATAKESWRTDGESEGTQTGCHLSGFLRLPRVPGHLDLLVSGGDPQLDLEPYSVNTSHRIHHFSFSVPLDAFSPRSAWSGLPREAMQAADLSPLDGQEFMMMKTQEAYEHHMRLVTLESYWKTAYPFVHFGRTAVAGQGSSPQLRFFFDLEPFAIQVFYEGKLWYDVVTSMLAALGGIFVLMRLLSRAALAVRSYWVHLHGPATSGRNGLLT